MRGGLAVFLIGFVCSVTAHAEGGCARDNLSAFLDHSFLKSKTDTVLLAEKATHVAEKKTWIRLDIGQVQASTNPDVQAAIDELAQHGGQLRRTIAIDHDGNLLPKKAAYFTLSQGKPIIALSEAADLATLRHEQTHLHDWLNLLQGFVDQGMGDDEALAAARKARSTPAYKYETERNAVVAGLQTTAQTTPAEVVTSERAYRFENADFASRVSYPAREALGVQLRTAAPTAAGVESNAVIGYMDEIIWNALIVRRAWFKTLNKPEAAEFTADELFTSVMGISGTERLQADKTLERAKNLFQTRLPKVIQTLPEDTFKQSLHQY